MPKGFPKAKSPNPQIDKALKDLFKEMATQPLDLRVKIIAQAISWEKAKFQIKDEAGEFDPDKL